jgi:hypothetical protein
MTVHTKLPMCIVRLSVNMCTPFLYGALRKHSQRLQIEWSEFFSVRLLINELRVLTLCAT